MAEQRVRRVRAVEGEEGSKPSGFLSTAERLRLREEEKARVAAETPPAAEERGDGGGTIMKTTVPRKHQYLIEVSVYGGLPVEDKVYETLLESLRAGRDELRKQYGGDSPHVYLVYAPGENWRKMRREELD